MAKHNKTGQIGEDMATEYLANKGYKIVERNYRKPWGELDIVAHKKGILYFIEVKTSGHRVQINPVENMHGFKVKRLRRIIETYIASKYKTQEVKWVFSLICVYLADSGETRKIEMLENLVLE